MRAIPLLLVFLSRPFWEAKPPEKWTESEIGALLQASPWAQLTGPSPDILVYLATAAPIEEAEREMRLRAKHPPAEPDPDYTNFLVDNRDQTLVLAIPYSVPVRFGSTEEQQHLDEESEMVIARKSYKLVGHFPPTNEDPVLRLVFPRQVKPSDKNVLFRLYLPGVPFPEREVEFRVSELIYRGKLAM